MEICVFSEYDYIFAHIFVIIYDIIKVLVL